MKRLFCLLFCLLFVVGCSGTEADDWYDEEYYEDEYWYDEEYYEDEHEPEYVMIEKELFEYYVEEIIGRASMTMDYLEYGKYDRDEAIYHLDEVLTIASLLQLDYLE